MKTYWVVYHKEDSGEMEKVGIDLSNAKPAYKDDEEYKSITINESDLEKIDHLWGAVFWGPNPEGDCLMVRDFENSLP